MRKVLFAAVLVTCGISVALADDELKPHQQLIAPSPIGPIGLFRTFSAERQPAGPLAFGQSLTGGYLQLSDEPVVGQNTQRLSGIAAVSYTPWKYLEFFVAGSAITSNDSSSALLVQQVGNFDFGAKFGRRFGGVWSFGPVFVGHYRRAVADLDLSDNAVSLESLLAGTANFLIRGFPMRVHLNVGYFLDQTADLVGPGIAERERIVLGILGKDAIIARIGVEIPLAPVVFSLEYSTEQSLKTAGVGYSDNPQRFTLGLRYFPTGDRALSLGLAGDVGMFAAGGPARLVKEPNWQLMGGLTYLFGTAGEQREVITAKPFSPQQAGTIVGMVSDAKSGQAIGGARVEFSNTPVSALLSDAETGRFRSYSIPEGENDLKVSRDGYGPLSQKVLVVRNQETHVDLKLHRIEPDRGVVVLHVKNRAGEGQKSKVALLDLPQVVPIDTDEGGDLRLRLPVGSYRIQATAEGQKSEPMMVDVVENREVFAHLLLRRSAEAVTKAQLGANEISILKQIQFKSGKAEILSSSMDVLDDVAKILIANPNIKTVEVGGHTDSLGDPGRNKELSTLRAQAVVNYLVSKEVEEGRLQVIGHGSERPIQDDGTPEGRSANRRVEFKILAQ